MSSAAPMQVNLQWEKQHVSFPSYLQACSLTHVERNPQDKGAIVFQGGLINASAPETDAHREL